MELDVMSIIAMVTIAVLIVAVSLAVINYIGGTVKEHASIQIKETFSKIVLSIFQQSPYNVCEALSDRQISSQEFQNLLLALANGQCGSSHANVMLSRSYSKEDMEKIARINGMAQDGKLIYYREAKPFGIGGLIVQGNPGYFVLKKWDTIEVWSVGKPIADTLIKVTVQGCDPYDEVCQPTCTYKKICDPVCDDGQKHDITCNIACIDIGNNGIDIADMEARVADEKCNPDCYTNRTNPFKAYDPGCVWKYKEQHDDICDPNSNGVVDGVCDPDCIDASRMCDFDCNGTAYEGNLMGLKDEKCFVCDGNCTGWCSPACDKNAFEDMEGYDPDCRRQVDSSFWCAGDGLCENEREENCENSVDCNQTCSDQNFACCPLAYDSDYAGCTATKDLKEGDLCSCSSQCDKMVCSVEHCCPEGKNWNGTACAEAYDVLIVALKSKLKAVYSDAQITDLENKIKEYTKSLSNDKLSGSLVYLDGEETSNLIGSKVTNVGDWNNIDGVLDQLLPKTKAKYLVIIGGYNAFPQPEISTGSCADPFFPTFQSDDLYADYNKDNMPEIPVGRIPDPNGGDISVLLAAFDTYTSLHNTGGLDLTDKFSIVMERGWPDYGCPKASSGICFNKDAFGISCFSSSCADAGTSYTTASGHKLFSLLVHGSFENPQPFADDQCNTGMLFMTSRQVSTLDVKNAVWMMMPCYSAFIKNKQQSADSTPMELLKNGGAVYFGGTLTQMGGVMEDGTCPSVLGGDYHIGTLYALVARELSVGKTIGQAYLAGKNAYSNIPDVEGCRFRQLHENLMYGDPSLKIKNV